MAEASDEAVRQAASLEKTISHIPDEPDSAASAVFAANQSLASLRKSYQRLEPSIFYVDPDSAAELLALPDPLLAGTTEPKADQLELMARSLENLSSLLQGGGGDRIGKIVSVWRYLQGESSYLLERLARFSPSWKAADPNNFRNGIFLASSRTAIGRIFQGIIAVSGDVIPNYWLEKSGAWREVNPPISEIAGRFRAVSDTYLGCGEDGEAVDGLFALVRQRSAIQADRTLLALEQSILLAEQLAAERGYTEESRILLKIQAEKVTNELILSAKALDIQFLVTSEGL